MGFKMLDLSGPEKALLGTCHPCNRISYDRAGNRAIYASDDIVLVCTSIKPNGLDFWL